MYFGHTLVQYPIPFMYKDPEELRKKLFSRINDVIIPSREFVNAYDASDLVIIIVHERKQETLKILGPSSGDNLVDYTFWLPYKQVKNSKNYKLEYFTILIAGLKTILEKYDFNMGQINKIFEEFLIEIAKEA